MRPKVSSKVDETELVGDAFILIHGAIHSRDWLPVAETTNQRPYSCSWKLYLFLLADKDV